MQAYGREHEKTLASAQYLADTQYNLGMYAESVSLRRQMIEILRRDFGETHVQTLGAEVFLIGALLRQGKWEEAREIKHRLLPIVSRVLGPSHRYTQMLLNLHRNLQI